jgi:hypothetical protein
MNVQRRPTLAARLTHRWVRVYTAHLDPARRDTRRAELASDVWEHQVEARRMGRSSLRVNVQIFRRLLAGIPADLSWRREPPDATPAIAGPAPAVAATPPSPWICRLRGHHYVTKRLPNKLDEGGFYCVCERCNHEKSPHGRPPAHWLSGGGPG